MNNEIQETGLVITLHRATLRAHNACSEGMDLFDEIAVLQERVDSVEVLFTPLAALMLSVGYPEFAAWLCGEGLLPTTNLYGADLYGADLYGASLRGASLSGANLCDANLCDADLCDADLCDADLRDANLRDANLRGANLRDANLCDADLCDADLSGANLRGTYRYSTDLAIPGWVLSAGVLVRS